MLGIHVSGVFHSSTVHTLGGRGQVPTRRNPYVLLAAIGLIALIAGLGRLVQAYREGGSLVPIPVLLASVAFGLLITSYTLRAVAAIFLDSHPALRASQVWLAILGTVLVLALAFLAGAASAGS
jgi:hypothetical protein